MWADQQALKAPGYKLLTKHNIYTQDDQEIKRYFADSIRYTIKGRRDTVVATILDSMNMIKTHDPYYQPAKNLVLQEVGWDQQAFQPIELFLEDLHETFEMLYYKISESEPS